MMPIYPGLAPVFIPKERFQAQAGPVNTSNASLAESVGAKMPTKSRKGCTIASVAEGKRMRALLKEDKSEVARKAGERNAKLFESKIAEQIGEVVYRVKKMDEAMDAVRQYKAQILESVANAPKTHQIPVLQSDAIASRYNQPFFF